MNYNDFIFFTYFLNYHQSGYAEKWDAIVLGSNKKGGKLFWGNFFFFFFFLIGIRSMQG